MPAPAAGMPPGRVGPRRHPAARQAGGPVKYGEDRTMLNTETLPHATPWARLRAALAGAWPVADGDATIAPLDGWRAIAMLLVILLHVFGVVRVTFPALGYFWDFGATGV